MAVEESANRIVRLIQSHRLDLSNEKKLQADIEQVLLAAGIAFERESRLSATDIPDFLTGDGVLIECKMHGAPKMAIYRQLRRYASHRDVKAMVLASNVSMGLPREIAGKPMYAASLSRGWI